jgi:hypothetical protein
MGWFSKAATPSVRRIKDPTLGILDLSGGQKKDIISADVQAISKCFAPALTGTSEPPQCDVLLIYADIHSDGTVEGATSGLREIIRDSAASVVVVASANDAASYVRAGKQTGYGRANLVMVLDRKGEALPKFLASLFSLMTDGVSMPVAWTRLAPQTGVTHADLPESIFACEIGQLAF